MSTRTVRLGIAGAGFMGLRTYVDAIRGAKHVLSENGVKVVLGSHYVRDRAKHAEVKDRGGAEVVTDNLTEAIDASDIFYNCLPNEAHEAPTIQAIEAGKHVGCEKPLGRDLGAAERICAAAAKAQNIRTLCMYCYTGADAVQLGRRNVEQGLILGSNSWLQGNGDFLQDWGISNRSNWRFDQQIAGPGGILDDLLQHTLSVLFGWLGAGKQLVAVKADLAYANGDGERLTFVDGTDGSARSRAVDAATATLKFECGSTFSLQTSRMARGQKARCKVALYGYHGAQEWDLHDGHRLSYCAKSSTDGLVKTAAEFQGWNSIHCSSGEHGNWASVPGLTRGYDSYFANLIAAHVLSVVQDTPTPTMKACGTVFSPFIPDFNFALKMQKITAAMLESGYKGGVWESLAV